MSDVATRNGVEYEADLAAWAEQQAGLLRAGEFSALDVENLAEEIEDLGRSARNELRSRLAVLLQHLVKWRYQPGHRSGSWTRTINVQRRDVEAVLAENPSLRRTLRDILPVAFDTGLAKAYEETGIGGLPETCPWTVEQVMSPEFLPD